MFSHAKSHVKEHQHLKLLTISVSRQRMEIKIRRSDQKQLMIQLHNLSRTTSISNALEIVLPDDN